MKWKVLTLVLERFWLQIYYKSENESAPWGKHHHIFFKNCVLYPIHTSEGTFFTKIFDRSLVLTKIQQVQMFSVLVMLEDSENVWSDHLRQKMANPAAKNRFFHFRHAVGHQPIYFISFYIYKRLFIQHLNNFVSFSLNSRECSWPLWSSTFASSPSPRCMWD